MDKKSRILIVDDESKNVELLEAILQTGPYELLTAENGNAALAVLEKEDVDLVLLDVMMPMIDGFEVVRRIRSNERTTGIPVILVTALDAVTERIKGIESGCDEFVSKPFDRHEIAARIKTLLRLNYYRTQVNEKEKFERVINRMHEGLLVCDPDMRMLRSNQRAREFLGSEDQSPAWLDRLAQNFRIAYYGDLRRDLTSMDLAFDLERPQTKAALPLILSFDSSLIKDTGGALSSVVILLHDVTDQRKEQFRKENFLSLMSDKLRQPLALGMQQIADLQASAAVIDLAALKLAVAQSSGTVMEVLGMMKKIFDFLAVYASSGAHPQHLGKAEVEELTRAAVEKIPGKKAVPEFRLPENLDLPVSRQFMGMLLENLVENAVKFNDKPLAKVVVSAVMDSDRIRFSVGDNGCGIPGEDKDNIFDAFFRGDKPAGAAKHGLGLGLAIVKKITESYGGEVDVKSMPDGGAEIAFSFPVSRLVSVGHKQDEELAASK